MNLKITVEIDGIEVLNNLQELINKSAIIGETTEELVNEIIDKQSKYIKPSDEMVDQISKKEETKIKEIDDKLDVHVSRKPRKCKKCGAEFYPRGNRQQFCSEECGLRPKKYSIREKEIRQTVKRANKALEEATERWARILNNVKNKQDGLPTKDKNSDNLATVETEPSMKRCKVCGDSFKPDIIRGVHMEDYCSDRCYNKATNDETWDKARH